MYKYIYFSNTHIKHMIYNIFISLKYISETEFCVIKYAWFLFINVNGYIKFNKYFNLFSSCRLLCF